ncbi:YHYH protein [Mycobacteroides immunogenum]|uniref:YHYH protein n=1 Tax=Mycobacteroides immunogenum TaxID=83262 RepID=UPI0025B778CB|nr:YHYH protein [Mycobacteroides immunogenum]WJR33208.1 YHYH protein [Mycobacteroides immunogenum]
MRCAGVVIWLICVAAISGCSASTHEDQAPVTLDLGRNYGDVFADGRLPVGDGKVVTEAPRRGYVYACPRYAESFAAGAAIGAHARGPWFSEDGQWYYPDRKEHVHGRVQHHGEFSETTSDGVRVITTNDLPRNHTTGRFPVATDDTAYQYDRNPNAITAQELTYVLASEPTYGAPQCVGHEVGVMLSGVVLFSALDAGGRDAGAWEVQDDCSGHPEVTGTYHYHTPSPCLAKAGVVEVVGYALDGFPITGARIGDGNILTTRDLDECHGISSRVQIDGRDVQTYHYVMTQDYPYSVNCFRGRPTTVQPPGVPPGR